jgi:hypothetical protein
MTVEPADLRHPRPIIVMGVAAALGLPWVLPALDWGIPLTDGGLLVLGAFAVAAIVGELLVLEPPRSRPMAATVAVLAAFALLGASPWQVAIVAVAGWAGAAIIHGFMDRPSHGMDLVHRLVAGWATAGFAAIGYHIPVAEWTIGGHAGSGGAMGPIEEISVAAIVLVAGSMILGSAVWDAAITERPEGSFWHLVRRHTRTTWVSSLALASGAALVAVAYGLFGPAALLLLFLPIFAVRSGLHRYTGIRRTYDQTVIAMTRMTELTGHVAEGHGIRVGQLASGIARTLGMSERDVGEVERAAHLHEVGRIATDDPEQRAQDREVALAGSAIVRQAGGLDTVAEVIERHRDPYRSPGLGDDESLPVAARVVRTACEYDRLTAGGANSEWEAIDELHRAMAYDHDPDVVQALSAYVERSLR